MTNLNQANKDLLTTLLTNQGQDELVIITNWEGKVELYNNVLSQLCNSANKDEILNDKVEITKLFSSEGIEFKKLLDSASLEEPWLGKLNFILNFNQIIPFNARVFRLSDDPQLNLKYLFRLEFIDVDEFERDPIAQKDGTITPFEQESTTLTDDNFRNEPYEELKRLKNDFLSSVSHELRTPLASIIGFTETIKNDPEMPSNLRNEFVDIVYNEGKRLASLVNDLLNISDLEKKNVRLNLKDHIVNNIVSAAFNNYKSIADEKSIDFELSLPKIPINAELDAEKIRQLVFNLISNALKFTPSHGKVNVELKSDDSNFEIIVTDTGLGIPKKDLGKIFNKFYRVYRPGMEFRGTGLGLAICKFIVLLHGGEISVESELNSGTKFIARIPIQHGGEKR
ncbi:MAG: HAMP domain-containing histidine kinase [Bacteroidetes bacterium]|nr:HAMP domain-containing histidine kinase [Bacteroidota bacterium]MBU2585305.1 HAMP domain-containing histidine kinase [Bacteroidota bacterium]